MNIISRKEAAEQNLKLYFTGKTCKNGHISERYVSKHTCIDCQRGYGKKWADENYEKLRVLSKKWKIENPEKQRASSKKWANKNPGYQAKYRAKNPLKVNALKAKFRAANPINEFFRQSLNRMFTNWKGGQAKAEKLMGYTISDLKSHLERQFVKGMSWENRSEWHIDHIIPIAHYLKTGVTDPAIINCLSNLQPIWARDNLKKNDKVLNLL